MLDPFGEPVKVGGTGVCSKLCYLIRGHKEALSLSGSLECIVLQPFPVPVHKGGHITLSVWERGRSGAVVIRAGYASTLPAEDSPTTGKN